MKIQCYLGLGSNLRSPKRQLNLAIRSLKRLPKTTVTQIAEFEHTIPLSHGYQPMYCNTVVEIKTTLSPEQLLQACLKIEENQKRFRKKRWASRTLDIDLLIYGTQKIRSKRLTIPHPRILERAFVYQPLMTLNPLILQRIKS